MHLLRYTIKFLFIKILFLPIIVANAKSIAEEYGWENKPDLNVAWYNFAEGEHAILYPLDIERYKLRAHVTISVPKNKTNGARSLHPIVLLHDAHRTADQFALMKNYFNSLGFTVIRFNLINRGLTWYHSTSRPLVVSPTWDADLIGQVFKYLQVSKAIVVGQGTGFDRAVRAIPDIKNGVNYLYGLNPYFHWIDYSSLPTHSYQPTFIVHGGSARSPLTYLGRSVHELEQTDASLNALLSTSENRLSIATVLDGLLADVHPEYVTSLISSPNYQTPTWLVSGKYNSTDDHSLIWDLQATQPQVQSVVLSSAYDDIAEKNPMAIVDLVMRTVDGERHRACEYDSMACAMILEPCRISMIP